MPTLWIVDRDRQRRAAIAQLAAATEDAVLGAPADPLFDAAPRADAVLLGLSGDFEAELQFAHRAALRLRDAAWILLAERGRVGDARLLFDLIDPEVLVYPPDARTLRWRLQSAHTRRGAGPLPLSQRAAREALTARFARWFADLDLPELLRALDPKLADVPLLIEGERGTGRSLLVRYVHAFGGGAEGALIQVPCSPESSAAELRAAIAARAGTRRARAGCTLWLEDVETLDPGVQRELRGWIEFAPPEGLLRTSRVRWVGTAGPEADLGLAPGLRQALAGLSLRIPPLRERRVLVPTLARDAARVWCEARDVRPRALDAGAIAALERHAWPGNLAELEAVVFQSLSASPADPLAARDLRCGGEPFAPAGPAASEALPVAGAGGARPVDAEPAEAAEEEKEANRIVPVEEVLVGELPEAEADAVGRGATAARGPAEGAALRRMAAAVAHAVRNPLSSIRTFAQLLPERFDDPEFRSRFAEVVDGDVGRIDAAVEQLSRLGALETPTREPVDATGLLDQLLEGQRETIRRRRLVVLKELDRDRPLALADPEQLRLAFEALVTQSLALVPERGDVYFASRYHPTGLGTAPSLRVLVRCRGARPQAAQRASEAEWPSGGRAEIEKASPQAAQRAEGERRPGGFGPAELPPAAADLSPARHSLAFAVAEAVVRAQGGAFAIDASERGETVAVMDLPAP